MKRNVLIAHGGGPTTVINGSLFGVIEEAKKFGDMIDHVYGAVHGIEGVLGGQFIDLLEEDPKQLALLPVTPSSVLGSCRRKLTEADYPRILELFQQYEIGFFFYNGGNDSMDTCYKIDQLAKQSHYPLCTVGIPKTIDNDLEMTDHCPGYGSAARYVANNTRDLWMEVQAMPMYVTVMETMGRNAGWLAAAASLPRYNGKPCAQLIYLPERIFEQERFLADVDRLLQKQREILIVVSEGITDETGEMLSDQGIVDGFGHKLAGGASQVLCDLISKHLGIKARAERSGFLGRASMVMQSKQDREEAVEVGRQAVRLAVAGTTGVMVSIQRLSDHPYRISLTHVPLESVANQERKFPDNWINSAGNGISEDFRNYCLPLLGEPLSPYAELKKIAPSIPATNPLQ